MYMFRLLFASFVLRYTAVTPGPVSEVCGRATCIILAVDISTCESSHRY